PRGPIRLLEVATLGERRRPVERTDVVQAEESALEDVVALGVFPVDPPREVQEKLVEDALQELEVLRAIDLEHPQRSPSVNREVDVAERPLIGGQLAVRMHIPL